MSRTVDLERFYKLLMNGLRGRLHGCRSLADCNGKLDWPRRGLYFFTEQGEMRADNSYPRVVRVGTHALTATSKTTLWKRLAQHRGTLNPPGVNTVAQSSGST